MFTHGGTSQEVRNRPFLGEYRLKAVYNSTIGNSNWEVSKNFKYGAHKKVDA